MTRLPRAAAHRIAMVLPRLDLGGMEHTVLAQASVLRARGLDVHLITFQTGGALRAAAVSRDIPVHEGDGLPDAGAAVAFLEETGRRLRLTHLHSHTGTWWPSARAARRLRIPHLHTRHGFVEAHDWRVTITEFLAARHTHVVICVSSALRQHTLRRLRVAPARCLLLRNGIDGDAFDAPLPEPREGDVPTVAMVCRLAPVKNVPLAVHALALLRASWPSLRMHLVGDGPEREAILAAARTHGVLPALDVHGASSAPWSLVPAGAIVMQSSDSEGLSLSLIEAMARGHRVVATDVGETRAFGEDAAGVLIVPPGDVQAMAQAVSSFLTAPHEAQWRQIAANREHARAHGALDHVVDELLACYERVGPR